MDSPNKGLDSSQKISALTKRHKKKFNPTDVFDPVRSGANSTEEMLNIVPQALSERDARRLAWAANRVRAIVQDMVRSSESLLGLSQDRLRVGSGTEQDVAVARANVGPDRDMLRQADLSREQALRALDRLQAAEVVADFQRLFMATWERQRGPPLPERSYFPPLRKAGDQVVRAIGSSPQDEHSLIYITLLSAIGSAQTSIRLTNAYFVPDPQLLAALKQAAARGVDVQLILPSSTDSWLVFHAGRAYYDELLQAGVRLYERHDALLHVKTAVIDGVWSTVGSTNLDWRSFLHNQEVNAVVLGNDFGDKMRAAFRADLAKSREITLPVWRERPLDVRVKELFARLWEYWL